MSPEEYKKQLLEYLQSEGVDIKGKTLDVKDYVFNHDLIFRQSTKFELNNMHHFVVNITQSDGYYMFSVRSDIDNIEGKCTTHCILISRN